uniref:Transcription factor n=1 Tax=Panagrellus redivivus TaxID=6233 RepID=A0A7E4W6D7_PANRE
MDGYSDSLLTLGRRFQKISLSQIATMDPLNKEPSASPSPDSGDQVVSHASSKSPDTDDNDKQSGGFSIVDILTATKPQ